MGVIRKVFVDWDAVDWSDDPDFSEEYDDITPYVIKAICIDRGKKTEDGNIPAGILDLTLSNKDGRFSPYMPPPSPLYGKIRPWLPVSVQVSIDGMEFEVIYTGFISKISINPDLDTQEAYLYCTDGADLLARNMVTQDRNDRTVTSDGGAVDKILDIAGWSPNKRSIDIDGGNIVKYPTCYEF